MTGILLPDKLCNLKKIERVKKILKERFDETEILFFSFDFLKFKEKNSIPLKTYNNSIYFSKKDALEFIKKYKLERLVIIKKDDDTNPNFSWEKIEFPIYKDVYNGECGLRSVDRTEIYEKTYNLNPLFSGKEEWIQLYPYNYFHSVQDITKIDKYGFRKQKILKNKKLIFVVGGSGGFDLCSLNKESFVYKLNKLVGDKFLVVNFSLPGYVLLNQFFLYILYLQKYNPYMIISYDGVNDFLNGAKNDKYLLKYNINYTHYLQNMAKKIYSNDKSFETPSLQEIGESYITRKIQFQNIVNQNNTKFISVLQPLVYSKKGLSKKERETVDNNLTKIYQNIPLGYKILDFSNIKYHLDLHQKFKQFNKTDTLFYKEIYQLKEANSFIATEIFNYIKELL